MVDSEVDKLSRKAGPVAPGRNISRPVHVWPWSPVKEIPELIIHQSFRFSHPPCCHRTPAVCNRFIVQAHGIHRRKQRVLLDRSIRRRRCRRDNLVGCVNILWGVFVRCVLINCDIVVGRVSVLRVIFVRRMLNLKSILVQVAHEILHIFFYLCFIGGFLIHLRPVMGILVV